MSVKEKILQTLENNSQNYISGEDMAKSAGVTRASIWKGINSLKQEGYKINAVTNKGYKLDMNCDTLSKYGIAKYLSDIKNDVNIQIYDTVTSTNTLLKAEAINKAPEGTIIISSSQTNGKGRFNRKFFSPSDCGIYLSILIRPKMNAQEATLITTAAAVSVCTAAEKLSKKSCGIKWVNDVLINSKKICGILTEASLDIESGSLDYAIVGIGINAYTPENGFDKDIKNIAGPVFDEKSYDLRNKLAAEVINNFFYYYNGLKSGEYLKSYREHCIVFGKKIKVLSNEKTTPATAIDIDNNCRLLVEYEDGKREYLSSGEISIRL